MIRGQIVVIGSNGQLGSDLLEALAEADVLPLTHADLDIVDEVAVSSLLDQVRPFAVVNTAAFHHTGKCEENPARAFEVNALGALNLARACERTDSLLVHVSTDYVFDGEKTTPYVESDQVAPLNVYGLSKAAGEMAVVHYCPRSYVVRTCGLYGLAPCRAKGDNFITKIRRIAEQKGEVTVVNDEIVTPTWTFSLARQVERLCQSPPLPYGFIHASDEGQCSWYEFTKEIFRLTSTKAELKPSSVDDAPSTIRRPRYSTLENKTLKEAGANVMSNWQDSLARYLRIADERDGNR